jgi:cell wall assembly regulator SMI1
VSHFTDKLYRAWLVGHGAGQGRRSGYGAQPHAERREGYPTGQTQQPETCHRPRTTWRHPASQATTREGSQRAKDAASRPEKPAVGVPAASPFLPLQEKSSGKNHH